MISGLSEAGLAAIRGSHSVRVYANVYRDHELITQNIPISTGQVQADRTANIRRTCTFTVANRDYIPVFATDPLTPYGQEAVIWYGVRGENMTDYEWVQLGVFVIQSTKWDEPDGVITVTGADRTIRLMESVGRPFAWIYYTNYPPVWAVSHKMNNVNVHAFIDLLIQHRAGGYVSVYYDPNLPFGPETRSTKGLIATDRWETGIVAAARLLGGEVYCDHTGNFRVVVPPKVTDDPVWTVDAGATGVLVRANRGFTREKVYNMCTVRSAVVGSYAWATVYDNDPESPTYPGVYVHIAGRASDVTLGNAQGYQAPYGEVHKVIDSEVSSTTLRCEIEARNWLHNQLGLLRSVSLEAVPNPALEPGDVITLQYYPGGPTENHLIDSFTIDLGGKSFSAETRTDNYQLPS